MSRTPLPRPEVSVIVPAFNEAASLPQLVAEIDSAMEPGGHAWELIVVDDGSTDETARTLARLAAEQPRLVALRHVRNAGQSAALLTGFRRAAGRVLVTLDGDLQNDPADIPLLIDALERQGADLVSGVRVARRDSWLRRLSSRIANGVRRRILHDGITDVGCSLKAWRREVLADLPTFEGMHRFLPALARLRSARIVELPVRHRPRRFGSSSYNVRNRLWRGIRDLVAVRWLLRRWLLPTPVEEIEPWNTPTSGSS